MQNTKERLSTLRLDHSPVGRISSQSLQLQIEDGIPPRESLFGDAFRLGVAYLLLTALFFGISSYIPGPEAYKDVTADFAGHSVLVEIMSGLTSFFIMSVAVWHLRKNRMMHNIIICFFISAVVSIADFISRIRPPGMGVGLRNIEQRLRARFQENAHFSAGCISTGRYLVAMELPWRQT